MPLSLLSPRELEFVGLYAQDLTMKVIAYRMGISVKSCDTMKHRLMQKLQIDSELMLVVYLIRHGLIEDLEAS